MRFAPSRHRLWLGPIYLYYTLLPYPKPTSWGIHLGLWTKNFTTGRTSFNLPGVGSIRSGKRRR